MDFSNLPHYQNIPGRQDAIDHASKIDKQRFMISLSVLFATAILSVVVRLAIRIFGHVPWSLDDSLNSIYLLEAINKGVVFPFQEDLTNILSIQKWSTNTAFLVWTSVYLVKFAFLYFFHTLVWVMIVIAFIRLIGAITDTRPDGHGAAPVWATYWSMAEGCVSLTMASVIALTQISINSINEFIAHDLEYNAIREDFRGQPSGTTDE
ncbi:hypothetical protein FHL15_008849 [Xylaria flabelliformis]|uniref:Uncharacterized protein n=1 Tax=Xylaria flabelliformis TaxID=2512241 RepID=A0A553HQT0_9PEZI|nr:hypothetical protein FHL15_008849 [Xylaria flabelliformis]